VYPRCLAKLVAREITRQFRSFLDAHIFSLNIRRSVIDNDWQLLCVTVEVSDRAWRGFEEARRP
jgi:hypothetical protein